MQRWRLRDAREESRDAPQRVPGRQERESFQGKGMELVEDLGDRQRSARWREVARLSAILDHGLRTAIRLA